MKNLLKNHSEFSMYCVQKVFLVSISLISLLMLGSCQEDQEITVSSLHEEMVDIGAYSLYTRTGGSKQPQVVLMTGLGGSTQDWADMEDELSKIATFINYDREGLGKSAWQQKAKDSKTIAEELHALILAKNIQPPYILVAHSLAGIHARVYAGLYPTEVAGMVLVDPTPENLIDSVLATLPEELREAIIEQISAEEAAALQALPEGGLKEEFKATQACYQQARALNYTTNAPIAILSSLKLEENDTQENKELAKKLRDDLLKQISTGVNKHYLSTNAGHYIQKEDPALVREAIEWVMANL